jgi:hypothetical protein
MFEEYLSQCEKAGDTNTTNSYIFSQVDYRAKFPQLYLFLETQAQQTHPNCKAEYFIIAFLKSINNSPIITIYKDLVK